MSTLTLSPNTRELLGEIRDWALTDVRPRAREADDICGYPADAAEVVARCPVQTAPLAFFDMGPRPSKSDDPAFVKSLEGGGSVLGLLAMEEMCYGDGWGWQALPGNNLGERAVRLLGSPDQIDKWAEGITRGEYSVTAICMTEDHCGSDLSQIATMATRDGDSWLLNGQKRFISNGATCDYFVVFAQTEVESGLRGIRAFIVEQGAHGPVISKQTEDKMGMRWFPQSTLEFNDVIVPANQVLAANDFGQIMSIMNGTRPYCAASAIGTSRAALDYAVDWVDQTGGSFTAKRRARLGEDVATMRGQLDGVRRLVLRAGFRHDRTGVPDPTFAAMAKGYALPITQAIAYRSVQMMGAAGFSRDHLVEKWYRDSKFYDLVEGTGQLHRIAIARTEIGRSAASA